MKRSPTVGKQFSLIYSILMLSSILIIVYLPNDYLSFTIMGILFIYGVLIRKLEIMYPYDPLWVNGWDDSLDRFYYFINYSIKISALYSLHLISDFLPRFHIFPNQIPIIFQVLLILLIIDFFVYWVHRLSHVYPFLWDLHSIHHSSKRLYFLNGEKRHALHQLLEGTPGLALVYFIGADVSLISKAFGILAINMFFQHTNWNYKSSFWKRIICTAEVHRWHHRQDYKDAQVNYGAWLRIWDQIFKSSFDAPDSREALGGVGIAEEPHYPTTYLGQFYRGLKKII